MNRGLFAFAALALLFASTGCHHNLTNNCNSCGGNASAHPHRPGGADHVPRMGHGAYDRQFAGPSGPPTASLAYPYYTTRGPRDFLLDNPPSIGH